jgi:hypothetical protein
MIKTYVAYLQAKVEVYRSIKYDWVVAQDEAVAKLRSITDKNEILKQTELLQKQIESAVACDWEIDTNCDIVLQQGYRFLLAEHFNLFLLANENIVQLLGNLLNNL